MLTAQNGREQTQIPRSAWLEGATIDELLVAQTQLVNVAVSQCTLARKEVLKNLVLRHG